MSKSITMSIIGAGTTGAPLAYLCSKQSCIQVQEICNSTLASAQNAVQKIGSGTAINSIKVLRPADIVMLSVSDDLIKTVCDELAYEGVLKEGTVVFHISALMDLSVLKSAKEIGCHVAMLHPIKCFVDFMQDISSFVGTPCLLHGDAAAEKVLQPLWTEIGAVVYLAPQLDNPRYHAALTVAMTFPRALYHAAIQAFIDAGIDQNHANELGHHLFMQAATAINGQPQDSINIGGPIGRAEIETITTHLEAIKLGKLKSLYPALASYAVECSALDLTQKNALLHLLA